MINQSKEVTLHCKGYPVSKIAETLGKTEEEVKRAIFFWWQNDRKDFRWK